MILLLNRTHLYSDCTIGDLYAYDATKNTGVFICNVLEDVDRHLESGGRKIHSKTAIPLGDYPISLNIPSSRFGPRPFYQRYCHGKPPALLNVPGFAGIKIHCGNNASHTEGCLLVGQMNGHSLIYSKETFIDLYRRLENSQKDNIILIRRGLSTK